MTNVTTYLRLKLGPIVHFGTMGESLTFVETKVENSCRVAPHEDYGPPRWRAVARRKSMEG